MKIVMVSLGTARRERVLADIEEACAAGACVELIVTKLEPWDGIPTDVRAHPLGVIEAKHPVPRIGRLLVLRLPRVIYRLGARVLSALSKLLPGRAGRAAERVGGRWKRAWTVTKERTDRFHRERFGSWYGRVRPYVLWRAARRRVLPRMGLDREPPDLIVVADGLSTPIGWHLVRKHPDAGVGFSLADARTDRELYASAGRSRRRS